jgi:Glycosyl transferase family 2
VNAIWLYTMSWNEERMLPFFFRHYDRWVDRYIVYDDGSTDRTLEMFAARGNVEVRRFQRSMPDSFVISATLLQNEFWKEARGNAAWAVITAIDEHLHHPDIAGYLARCRQQGVTAIPVLGMQMLADGFPDSADWLAATHVIGAPFDEMNKLSIVDPNQIDETHFTLGRHLAEPAGRVVYPAADEVLNLHYKYLGRDYVQSRHALLAGGLGKIDRNAGLGHQYSLSPDGLAAEWQKFAARALDYRNPAVGVTTHPERWWRGA